MRVACPGSLSAYVGLGCLALSGRVYPSELSWLDPELRVSVARSTRPSNMARSSQLTWWSMTWSVSSRTPGRCARERRVW